MFRPWRVKAELTQKSLTITESVATWIVLIICGSATTQFLSMICINSGMCVLMNSMLVANQFPLSNCIVKSEIVFDVELWCQQRINFFCQIVVPQRNLFHCRMVASPASQFRWQFCVPNQFAGEFVSQAN